MTTNLIPSVYAIDETVDIQSILDTTPNFFKYKCIGDLVANGVNVAIILSGIIMFVMLVWGGMLWLTSAGDKAHIEDARNKIVHAIIGITIIAAAYAIWILVLTFFGINGDICKPNTI